MLDKSTELQDIINRLTTIYAEIDDSEFVEAAEELTCIIEELKKYL